MLKLKCINKGNMGTHPSKSVMSNLNEGKIYTTMSLACSSIYAIEEFGGYGLKKERFIVLGIDIIYKYNQMAEVLKR